MVQYIQITDAENNNCFRVEIAEEEIVSQGEIVEAGRLTDTMGKIVGKTVNAAQTTFEQAVDNVLKYNARAFLQAIRTLPPQDQPEEMEVTFALKAAGEVGSTTIAKGTGEANYTIKLTWKR